MTATEFVTCCFNEKASLLVTYFAPQSGSQVAKDIARLKLSSEQRELMQKVANGILTDAFCSILLGLDGAASLGGVMHDYDLRAEDGTRLTGEGEMEEAALEKFRSEQEGLEGA